MKELDINSNDLAKIFGQLAEIRAKEEDAATERWLESKFHKERLTAEELADWTPGIFGQLTQAIDAARVLRVAMAAGDRILHDVANTALGYWANLICDVIKGEKKGLRPGDFYDVLKADARDVRARQLTPNRYRRKP